MDQSGPIPWRLAATSAVADCRALIAARGPQPVVDCAGCERLPVQLLIAAGDVPLRLGAPSAAVRAFASRCLRPRLVVDEVADAVAMPFQVAITEPATVEVRVEARAGLHPALGRTEAHAWIGGVDAAAVVVGMHQVGHVNSVLVAWLLLLVQHAKPARLRLDGASAAVQTQLRQLRLDHLMTIG